MAELHILSGKYKGTKLVSPNLTTTHPMGSREKLALFNMLSPYLDGATVLDYFAGSGALGLEALSRGAARVDFVESSPKAVKVIKNNIKLVSGCFQNNKGIFPREITNTHGLECATVRAESLTGRCDFEGRKIPRSGNTPSELYDIVISDPPYDNYQVPDYASLLKKGGVLALSHPGDFNPQNITGLTLLKTNHYAACHISLFTK